MTAGFLIPIYKPVSRVFHVLHSIVCFCLLTNDELKIAIDGALMCHVCGYTLWLLIPRISSTVSIASYCADRWYLVISELDFVDSGSPTVVFTVCACCQVYYFFTYCDVFGVKQAQTETTAFVLSLSPSIL